jgi:signal transduction histidine kinase
MFEGPVIIWAASRAPSPAERRVISQAALAVGASVRVISSSALGSEIVSAIVQGPVVVVVDSRKDAAAALRLGADETVRLASAAEGPPAPPTKPRQGLRKRRLQDAIERALGRPRARTRRVAHVGREYPGLSLLIRVVERRLGSPLNQAALKCNELAQELTKTVAVADGLMQRVREGSAREELRGWSKDVKQYAEATLRAEALVSELREQVERGDAIIRLLGDLSVESSVADTDAEYLLRNLAELLRADVDQNMSLVVETNGPCLVAMDRPAFLCIVCAVVENALENIRAANGRGRLELRASKIDAEVLIEVADDGVPNATDLRTSIVDTLVTDPRTAKLREVRERLRAMDGELTVDADEAGTVVSLYLPTTLESVAADAAPPRSPFVHVERRNR